MPAPIVLRTLTPEVKKVDNPPSGQPVIATKAELRDGSRPGGSTPVGQVAFSALPIAPAEDITSGRFVGAFKLPNGSLDYSRGAIGISKDGTKLFAASFVYDFEIKEFLIPELVNESANTALLNAATQTQASGNLYSRIPVKDWPNPTGNDDTYITGLYDTGTKLLVTAIEAYDADGSGTSTVFSIDDKDNLSGSTVSGAYVVGTMSHANGWIVDVPPNLTEAMSGDLIFGYGAGASIVSRLSNGPSLWSVNLSDLESAANGATISSRTLINYPIETPLRTDLYNYGGASGGVNNDVHTTFSKARTGFIVPGTRTYAVVGESGGHNPGPLTFTQQAIGGYSVQNPGGPASNPYVGTTTSPPNINGAIFYKNDVASWTTKQGSSVSGDAVWDETDNGSYLWLYDLDEVSALANPYDAEPYFAAPASASFNGSQDVEGACFNASTGFLYVFTTYENGLPQTGEPVIMVFDMNGVV